MLFFIRKVDLLMTSNWQKDIEIVAKGIRIRTLEHTIKNNGGYLSQACSSAEIFASLYLKILNIGHVPEPITPKKFMSVPKPQNNLSFTGANYNGPKGPSYDRFILSPAQYALVLYSTLIETKRMADNGLDFFNADGSSVEMIGAEHSPGMEVMTGSLGQGISQGSGIAFARKRKGENGRVVIFLSDGELQIGQTWEAIQSMVYHKLDNMLIIIDVNGFQCDGKMTSVMNVDPIDERFKSFGASVYRINGHNIEDLVEKCTTKTTGKPTVVIADTNPTKDLEILKNRYPKYHYVRFVNEDEKNIYINELNKMNTAISQEGQIL